MVEEIPANCELQGEYENALAGVIVTPSPVYQNRTPGTPLFTVPLGQSLGLGQAQDVAVTELLVNRTVFEKNELAVVGQNLLQEYHQEFNAYPQGPVTYVPRGVYGTIVWRN